jgi:hypothetical protein
MIMDINRSVIISWLLLAVASAFFTSSVNASARYVFSVSGHSGSDLHLPIEAELVLSDAAVSTGQATNTEIESLRITSGSLVRDDNPMTLSLMHTSFTNWVVTLSEDRQKITALGADINGVASDYWLLYQQHPPHPDLQIHENLGYIRSHSVVIETTLLPVPPSYESSNFRGEWRRDYLCRPCRIFEEWVICFPFCLWPWMIITLIIVLPLLAWRIRKRNSSS